MILTRPACPSLDLYTAGVTTADENPSPPRRAGAPRAWLVGTIAALLGACAASTIGAWDADGDTPGPARHVAAVIFAALGAGSLAALYAFAGAGFGRVIVRWTRPAAGSPPPARELEFLTGLGAMLVASHLLGWLGVLTAATAWAVVGVGVALWLTSIVRAKAIDAADARAPSPRWWLLALPGVAVMLAVASSPPGWLWMSEAGGYDTLSYHLQLVREWLAAGRLTPLDHNIYSFLPSYAEGAFLHLAHMAVPLRSVLGAGAAASVGSLPETAILGAAWLHAFVAIGAAMGLARVVGAIIAGPREAAILAGAALAATPWVVVVGSLAYSEMFVVALGVGCVLAAVTAGLSPTARGVLIGLMGSAAVGAKPTALFMLAPVVLAALFVPRLLASRRACIRFGLAAAIVGTLAGSPWLIRNYAAAGNPVFPFAQGVFGDGPWVGEQHRRYQAAHRFEGSLAERFSAVVALPTTGAGNEHTHGLGDQPRGLFHEQWSILFPLGVVGLGLGVATPRTRRWSGAMLAALVVQLGAWLALTHIQSRFLLPCVIPLALGVGLGVDAVRRLLGDTSRARMTSLGVGVACVAWLGLRSILIFAGEHKGRPNALLAFGVDGLTGTPLIHQFSHIPPEMRAQSFSQLPSPEVFINVGGLDDLLPPPGRGTASLYLFGDSTPFYFAHPAIRVLYNTTYDRLPWAFGAADPATWARALRDRGVQFVLVNTSELARLHRSGWYDPAVTPELVEQFVNDHANVIAAWPRRGQRLCVLKVPGWPVHPSPGAAAGSPR